MTQPVTSADPQWELIRKYASWIRDDLDARDIDAIRARGIVVQAIAADPATLPEILFAAKEIHQRNDGVYLPVAARAAVIIDAIEGLT